MESGLSVGQNLGNSTATRKKVEWGSGGDSQILTNTWPWKQHNFMVSESFNRSNYCYAPWHIINEHQAYRQT